ncbi:hypothetical protein LCGC14_2517970, partial [marine sediment metagenome]
LVEQHIIKKSYKNWDQIDNLAFLSKNLYNSAIYTIKQEERGIGQKKKQ